MHRLFRLLILLSVALYGQQRIISHNSDGFTIRVVKPELKKNMLKEGVLKQVDYYTATGNSSPGTLKLPVEELIIAIPPNSKPEFQLKVLDENTLQDVYPAVQPRFVVDDKQQIVAEPVAAERVVSLNNRPFEVLSYFWYRDFYCARLRVPLARFNNTNRSITETVAYEIQVKTPLANSSSSVQPITKLEQVFVNSLANASIAARFRAAAPKSTADTTGNWIVYQQQYLKIGTYEDKVYRITPQTLQQTGISANVDPATFKLFDRGMEKPVYLNHNGNTTFETGEYIEFYGTKNYNKGDVRIINPAGQPYVEYLNRYSDTTFMFLTWGGTISTVRAGIIDGNPAGVSDTLKYYTDVIHAELDSIYQGVYVENEPLQDAEWQDAKSWFWSDLLVGTLSREVLLNDIYPGKTASVYAKLVSGGSNIVEKAHHLLLGLKKTTVVSDTNVYTIQRRYANRNERVLLGGTISTDSLKQGSNVLIVRNYENGTTSNSLKFDWYEVEVPKYLHAVNNRFYFEVKEQDQTGLRNVKVKKLSGAASGFVVYRVKPDLMKIEGVVKNADSSLSFKDNLQLGNAYLVYPVSEIVQPQIVRSKQFSNLRAPRRADYITITHPRLYTSAKTYTGFIKSTYQVDTTVVLIDDIYDEFTYGYPEPAAIRGFLQAAATGWSGPKPSAVNLIGTACYDYKRITFRLYKKDKNENLVPSYGEPVSDTWFTMFNGTSPMMQEMLIGRLPARTPETVNAYLEKHRRHSTQSFDIWNKQMLCFSGGESDNESEIGSMKAINQVVVNRAVGGSYALDVKHFYKTYNPQTFFGPYTPIYVNNSIAEGGVCISYIGHSGTDTWDNTIDNPDKLLNNKNKGSLVTDFGCSTNKFAEPDIDCFGKRFVNEGQAIAYVGNSSLGFQSTTSMMSDFFYTYLLQDSARAVGAVHYSIKNYLVNEGLVYGPYRYFILSNSLIGDPLIEPALPQKANLQIIGDEFFSPVKSVGTEEDSLAAITIRYRNIGRVVSDSILVRVKTSYNGTETMRVEFKKQAPTFYDSIYVEVPTKRKVGKHILTVELDTENKLTEYDKADNVYNYSYQVVSSAVRPILKAASSGETTPVINVLNPLLSPRNSSRELIVQTDTTEAFTSPVQRTVPIDTFYTKLTLNNLTAGKRQYLRTRVNSSDTTWSAVSSLKPTAQNAALLIDDKNGLQMQQLNHLYVTSSGVKVTADTLHFVQHSCGALVKNYGALYLNDSALVAGIGVGMYIGIVDSATLKVELAEFFNYGNIAGKFDSLVAIIRRIPFGKIVFMGVVTDGISDANTFKTDSSLMKAILTLGASKVKLLGYRQPWLLMGKKGLAEGQAVEFRELRTYPDTLRFDTTLFRKYQTGYFTTNPILAASKWKYIKLAYDTAAGAGIKVRPIVLRTNGIRDTLGLLNLVNNTADLSVLDTILAKEVQFQIELSRTGAGESHTLKSVAIDFEGGPELGCNYETVTLSNTRMTLGKTDSIKVQVINAGYGKAQNVKVLAEVITGARRDTIGGVVNIPVLNPGEKKYLVFPYNPGTGDSQRVASITIDPANVNPDYYPDNNNYRIPFVVAVDRTLKPYVNAYVDSSLLIDGDFISATPKLSFEVFDPTVEPIIDSTVILSIYDNDKRIFIKDNPQVRLTFSPSNPKLKIDIQPTLSNGEHVIEMKVLSGSRMDTIPYRVQFFVQSELQILDLYNYPNPFKDQTNFVFQLSKVPETFSIKIYTVAGRLIRTIDAPSGLLRIGYNKSLVWDGNDQDGNKVASGVYLAKVIAKLQGKTISNTMKIAVVR